MKSIEKIATKKELIMEGDKIEKEINEYFKAIICNLDKFNIDKRFGGYMEEFLLSNIRCNFDFLNYIINDNEHDMSDDKLEEWLNSNRELLAGP